MTRALRVPGLTACLLALLCACAGTAAQAAEGKTRLTWYGHAAFRITTPAGHVLLIDPWITNPGNKQGKADLEALGKVDLILISHGHSDHVGNAVEIAGKTGAKLVSTFDLGRALVAYADYPEKAVGFDSQGNFGGTLSFFDGEVKITFVPAVHGSGITVPRGAGKPADVYYGGNPAGFLVSIRNGPTFYHTGDTDVFSDMKLIPLRQHVDVMLACIGDHFTMGPRGAAVAVEMVKPDVVIPMHYGTFPVLTGTPEAFRSALEESGAKARLEVMKVDDTIEF